MAGSVGQLSIVRHLISSNRILRNRLFHAKIYNKNKIICSVNYSRKLSVQELSSIQRKRLLCSVLGERRPRCAERSRIGMLLETCGSTSWPQRLGKRTEPPSSLQACRPAFLSLWALPRCSRLFCSCLVLGGGNQLCQGREALYVLCCQAHLLYLLSQVLHI